MALEMEPPSRPVAPRRTSSDLLVARLKTPHRHRHRRRSRGYHVKNSPFHAAGGRRNSGLATPFLNWKLDDADRPGTALADAQGGWRESNNPAGGAPVVSSRRLAAGLWHLQLAEAGNGGRRECSSARLGIEHIPAHIRSRNLCNHNQSGVESTETLDHVINHGLENGISQKIKTISALPNPLMENAKKWDPVSSKKSKEVNQFYGHLKLIEGQQVNAVSIVSALQTELEQARSRVHELETERRTSKKKLDHFLKKLAEEKASWRRREHEKVCSIIEAIKDDLVREKKSRQRLEIVNSKLVNELAEAKSSAKRYLQDYEKERKARELMEEVCDELAKEIGEDKAEAEAVRRESLKIREEADEERRMLQMAEVWREERVQMKLVDAKLTLGDKYSKLSKLQADIEAFLRGHGSTDFDPDALKEALMLREAANSIKVQNLKEFHYQPPPASEDIFSVFEELQPREETKERDNGHYFGYSPASHASKIHTVSPETDVFLEKSTRGYAIGSNDGEYAEDDSGWETVSHIEEQGSCNSQEDSEPSVNGTYEESHASVSGTDLEDNEDTSKLASEISEICSETTKLSRNKGSSLGRIWRSSRPTSKNYPLEFSNGNSSSSRVFNGTPSPDIKSGEVVLSSPSVGQCSSPDTVKPCITRGTKGHLEWSGGMQKQSLKAKLLEARMGSQKIHLRKVLEK